MISLGWLEVVTLLVLIVAPIVIGLRLSRRKSKADRPGEDEAGW